VRFASITSEDMERGLGHEIKNAKRDASKAPVTACPRFPGSFLSDLPLGSKHSPVTHEVLETLKSQKVQTPTVLLATRRDGSPAPQRPKIAAPPVIQAQECYLRQTSNCKRASTMGSTVVRTGQGDLASRRRSIQDKPQAVSTLQQELSALRAAVLLKILRFVCRRVVI